MNYGDITGGVRVKVLTGLQYQYVKGEEVKFEWILENDYQEKVINFSVVEFYLEYDGELFLVDEEFLTNCSPQVHMSRQFFINTSDFSVGLYTLKSKLFVYSSSDRDFLVYLNWKDHISFYLFPKGSD